MMSAAAPVKLPRFTHVVASDITVTHLDVAIACLSSAIDPSRISYTLSKGEDLALHHSARSADMIVSAEAVVLMHTGAGLRSLATVLKPEELGSTDVRRSRRRFTGIKC